MSRNEKNKVGGGKFPLYIGRVVTALIIFAAATMLVTSCDRIEGIFGGEEEASQSTSEDGGTQRGAGGQESGDQEAGGQGAEEEQTVFAVSTTKAVEGQLKDYIEVNGDVVAKTTVQTFPDASGKLSELYIELGDWVRKNQVVAKVDPSKPGMKYEASPVKAPISGTVTELPSQEGSTVSPQMSVAQISTMGTLQVRTDVAERFISKMQRGLRVVITSEAYPERTYEGRVAELSPVVDPQARMMEVKINFTEGSPGLKSGMFVEAKIITEKKEGVVKLPVDCVVSRFGEEYAFVVKETGATAGSEDAGGESSAEDAGGEIVERRVVKTGIEVDRKVEILEGIEAGEQVVYRGQTLLEDGSRVRVVSQVEPLSEEDVLE